MKKIISRLFKKPSNVSKPKYIVIETGVNGGVTKTQIIEIYEAITKAGFIPLFNRKILEGLGYKKK